MLAHVASVQVRLKELFNFSELNNDEKGWYIKVPAFSLFTEKDAHKSPYYPRKIYMYVRHIQQMHL